MTTWRAAARRFVMRLAGSMSRRRDEERMREEMEMHLALRAAEYERTGLSSAEARRRALLEFGGVDAIGERYRDEQRLPFLDHVTQDVRYALRQLRQAPLFTFTAALSLAIGIGAATAIFTLVDHLLLRPLPVSNPHELVLVTDHRSGEQRSPRFSYPFYAALRGVPALQDVAARFSLSLNAAFDERVARVSGELISGSYFNVLGASTQMGRPLLPEDDRTPGAHAVAVISDGFWRRTFGADPAVLGRTLRLNHHTFTIIGVAARGFIGIDVGEPTDIWIPMLMQREVGRDLLADSETNWLEIIGRLPPGANIAAASAGLAATHPRLLLLPGDKGSSSVRQQIGPSVRVLQALTLLALMMACINVASLLVIRSIAREKEIAVRLALGARRSRLVRQYITEALVLATLGGAAGLLAAPWTAGLLAASHPGGLGIEPALDARIFAFGLALTLLTGLAVSLAPMIVSRKVGLAQVCASAARPGGGASSRSAVHQVIVAAQVALSLVMLIGAALFAQSLRSLSAIDLGIRADNLLVISVDPGSAGYDGPRIQTFWRDAIERVRQVQGADSVSLARIVPMAYGRSRRPLPNPAGGGVPIEIDINEIAPRYFHTVGVPLRRGRDFDARDERGGRPVIIVNERLARMFWPGQDAVGKGLRINRRGSPDAEVVGVVADVKYRDLTDPVVAPMVYIPIAQSTTSDGMTLHVRTAGDPGAVAGTIRRELQALDPQLPLFEITTLADRAHASLSQTRQAATLTGGFALLALLLSGVGVYGVTALAVSRRTREIGIRMALGAEPRHIVRVIGWRGVWLVIAGVGAGVMGALAFGRLAAALLYGVTATDVPTFTAMSAMLTIVSLVAIYIPARAATRLDAVTATRCD
jgi:predicted permease